MFARFLLVLGIILAIIFLPIITMYHVTFMDVKPTDSLIIIWLAGLLVDFLSLVILGLIISGIWRAIEFILDGN